MAARTAIVFVPLAQRTPLSMTIDGFLVFEIDYNLIIPVRTRPMMPGVHDWANCETKGDVFDLALMVNLEHDKKKAEEETKSES